MYEAGTRFVNVPDACHDIPPLTENSKVPYPPSGFVIVIVPSFAPLHVTLVLFTVAESTGGSVIKSVGFRVITQAVLAASLIMTS